MGDALPAQELTHFGENLDLSEQEQLLVYNVEALGMPVARAAKIAGVNGPYVVLKKPNATLRGRTDFTREDVLEGMKNAIDQAVILADPLAQISGWKEIAKLQGFDRSGNVTININGTAQQVQRQIQGMTTEQLLELTGERILDADFYEVKQGKAAK
jgi:hypothetical protein